jgi:ferredoxin/flavodoxin
MGRRKFLAGSAGAALTVAFGRVAGILGLLAPAQTTKALDKTQPIVNKKLKGIVVYYSATGNTAQIANAIYKGMNSVISCDVVPIKKMNPKKMSRYDVMAIGSPNWFMREVAVLRSFTDNMPRMEGKHCVLFCTHGTSPVGQFWSMSRNPLRKGMTIIGWSDWSGPNFMGWHGDIPHPAWGHPDSIDLAEAEAFGKRMAEHSIRISAGETELIPEIPKPDVGQSSLWSPSGRTGVPGFASPPRETIPQFDLSKCVYPRCTQCADNCPVNAIDLAVMASAGSVAAKGSLVTLDEMLTQYWSNQQANGRDLPLPELPLVIKNACVHCGGMCQRVCNYDAILCSGDYIEEPRMTFNMQKCTYPKCTLCADECPQTAIDLTQNPPVIHNRCEAEGLCWSICPHNAIELHESEQKKKSDAAHRKVWSPFQDPDIPNARLRDLVRKEDRGHDLWVLDIKTYPRTPLKKDLWPFRVDDQS